MLVLFSAFLLGIAISTAVLSVIMNKEDNEWMRIVNSKDAEILKLKTYIQSKKNENC
jgi:uncharacterized membrane protein